jgi:hypothetical protein
VSPVAGGEGVGLRSVVLGACLCSLAALAQSPDGEKTWEGTWINRQYSTTGPLKCVARPEKDGNWKATFSGTFRGRDFRYEVTFKAKAGKGQEALTGTATVSGTRYQWTGVMKGNTLTGRYQGNDGAFGDFSLKSRAKK